jgi:S-methylmethionine-dependent homocysteine/selenocysteine methylase
VDESDINRQVNTDAARFMRTLLDDRGEYASAVKIGGLVGCKNDCYRPEEGLSTEEAEAFHSWQVDQLASSGVDFLIAETLPGLPEAAGIARLMAGTGHPYLISFVINRRGQVLDGTALPDAVDFIDNQVSHPPLGFLVNCAHPSFLCAARQPRRLYGRLIGYLANASSLDHAQLDGAGEAQADDIAQWGVEMLSLNRTYGVKILGGCCGTGVDHLNYLIVNR